MKPERAQKIDQITSSALELPPEHRAQFLANTCADDSDLRKEVESRVERHEPGQRRQVGEYRIQKLLGAGGMGEVYLAIDRMGRRVALKLLAPKAAKSRQHVARFSQEAQTLLALNHPNIVTIYNVGESEGTCYIASELIEGENLRVSSLSGNLELDVVLDIAVQITTALAAAHEKGIIHRDIKPENVMLRSDGYAKVLDFGIAKLTEDFSVSIEEAPTLPRFKTTEGIRIGTINYMSPEQLRSSSVDMRTDIWSCGVLLYELLTGQTPFGGKTDLEVAANIMDREPLPLSRFMREPPAELQRIVDKAVMKKPEERYQTIKDMNLDLKALKHSLDFAAQLVRSALPVIKVDVPGTLATPDASRLEKGLPTRRPVSSAEYLVSKIKQHQKGIAVLASIAVLGLVSIGYWYFNRPPSSPFQIDSVAVLPFANESGNSDVEYLSDGMTESLINGLSQLPKLSVKARSLVFRYKGKDVDPRQVARDLSVQTILTGRFIQHGDDLTLYLSLVDARTGNQVWGEQYNRKLADLVSLQTDIARDVSQKIRARLSGSEEQKLAKHYPANPEAYRLYLNGRYHLLKANRKEEQTAVTYYQQAIAIDPNYARAYVGLADAYRTLALTGELSPRDVLPQAKAAALKAVGIDDTLGEAHAVLGYIMFWYDWNWSGAENEFKRALELDPNSADTHQFYSHLLSNIGRHAEALVEAKRARELDPVNLRINALEGQCLMFAGQIDAALERLQKTMELDPNYYNAHVFSASAYIEKGMYTEAIAEARRAIEVNSNANNHPLAFVGYAFAKSGKQSEARGVLAEMLRLSTDRYVSPYDIALVYNGLGERDEVLTWLERGYEARDLRMTFLKVEPKWSNLRADPRFQNLLRRVGFL